MSRHPRRVGAVRRRSSVALAHVRGWSHGFLGSERRIAFELDKLKEQAEGRAQLWAAWWGATDGQLKGEYCALLERIQAVDQEQQRLSTEIETAKNRYATEKTDDAELSLRHREREVERARRQLAELRDKLARAREARVGTFQLAKHSALGEVDYRQELMRAYCSSNKRAPELEHLPAIELPRLFDAAELDWTCGDVVPVAASVMGA